MQRTAADAKADQKKILQLAKLGAAEVERGMLQTVYRAMLTKALQQVEKFSTPSKKQSTDRELERLDQESYLRIFLEKLDQPLSDSKVQKLLNEEPLQTICETMLYDLYCQPDTLFHFVSSWLQIFSKAQDIANECYYIENKLNHTPFAGHNPLLHKLGVIQALEVVLALEKPEDLPSMRIFFGIHTNPFWKGGYGNTSSLKIYNAILSGDKQTAEELLQQKKIKFEKECEAKSIPKNEIVMKIQP